MTKRSSADADPRRWLAIYRDHIAMFGIFAAFIVLYACSIGVDRRNLAAYNFVMDADPGRVLNDALHGQAPGVLIRHPLFQLTIGSLARGIAVGVEPRASVLYAVTLLSGAAVAAAFWVLRSVCSRLLSAVLLTGLYGFAATTWVLSSIPETFAISSGMIILIVLIHRPEFAQPHCHPGRFVLNAIVAALAVGVAVPNLVYVALGMASNLRSAQTTTRRRIAVFAAYSVSAFVAFVLLGIIQRGLFPDRVGEARIYDAPIVAALNDPYLRFDRELHPGEAGRLIRAFTFDNLVAPIGVVEVVRAPDGPQTMIQYGGRTSMLAVCAALVLVAFIVSIAWSARLSNVVADHRAQFALSIVVYNIVFHFFYRANGQPFIFTMHTVFALTLLLAFAYEASTWRWRSTALASALALLVVNNAVFVGFVDRALAKECVDFAGHVCLTWAPPVDSARLDGGVAEFRQSADYPFELGRVAFTEDKLDESIALLQRALSMDQDHELAQLYLGAALIRANRIDDAIAYLTAALHRNPSNGNLRRLLLVAQQRAIKS